MNLIRSFNSRLGSRGSSSIEFVLLSLVAVPILLCGIDLVNYARARLTLDEVSNSLASIIAGYKELYVGDFPPLYQVSKETAGSLDVTQSNGLTVFTGITNPKGTPVVAWRQHVGSLKSGDPNDGSSLGPLNGVPTNMPDNYVVPLGSSVIAVEVFSSVHPWVLSELLLKTKGQPILGSITILQPRSALLSLVSPEKRP